MIDRVRIMFLNLYTQVIRNECISVSFRPMKGKNLEPDHVLAFTPGREIIMVTFIFH